MRKHRPILAIGAAVLTICGLVAVHSAAAVDAAEIEYLRGVTTEASANGYLITAKFGNPGTTARTLTINADVRDANKKSIARWSSDYEFAAGEAVIAEATWTTSDVAAGTYTLAQSIADASGTALDENDAAATVTVKTKSGTTAPTGDATSPADTDTTPADETGVDGENSSGSATGTPPTSPGISGDWNLAFNDEFNGTSLDLTKWIMCNPSFENSCVPYNEEQQKFNVVNTGNANVKVSDGQLHLIATKTNGQIMSGMVSTGPDKFGYNNPGYKGFQFTYGYYEGRVKLPKGSGYWPSMWMLPDQEKYGAWPDSGEYDVFEIPGNDPTEYHFTAHWGGTGGECGHPCTPQQAAISDSSTNWHIFGLDWEQDGLTWYVDGKKMGNTVNDEGAVKDTPFYIIANFSVGGTWGPLNGGPDASTPFPASYDIDYLRVWQHA